MIDLLLPGNWAIVLSGGDSYVRRNYISNTRFAGILTYNCEPDLGISEQDKGDNCIFNSLEYHVKSFASETILAKYNYWDSLDPDKFSANVVWQPYRYTCPLPQP